MCEATIQGIDVTEPLSVLVEVTGAKEDLTFYITRPVPTLYHATYNTSNTASATVSQGNFILTHRKMISKVNQGNSVPGVR